MNPGTIKDLRKAKLTLEQGRYSFVIYKNSELLFSSTKKWLNPYFDALDENPRIFEGAVVGDRVVGRAAAYCCTYVKPVAVVGMLMTYDAISILEEHACIPAWRETIPYLTDLNTFMEDTVEVLLKDALDGKDALRILRACP